ncbi:hypothetical protein CcaverHIS002_0502420 [Cutaneotrichosporon cavernicola]|nr:hypothetical protein CcaverHIS002_0502420 [Cutaneotrichosporon cavernicola]
MPTDALLRPAALHQFTSNSAYDERMSPSARERWSPTSSDSGDDESTDARDEDELNNAPHGTGSCPGCCSPPLGRLPPPRHAPAFAASLVAHVSSGCRAASSDAPSPFTPSRPWVPLSLPKGQPLARSLLNRAVNGASQPQRPKKTTKLIVATKPMRTTFQLSLSAEELARKS